MSTPSTGPKSLQPVHVQILDYIMANPHVNYGEVAAVFGYTQSWISQIVHSDAFQALLAERQIEVFGDIKLTIKDRVTGLAHESLKRLTEIIPTQTDPDKVVNAADMALKALGFGASKGAAGVGSNTQNNNLTIVGAVDPATLAAARQLMNKSAPVPGEPKLVEAAPATAP